MKRKDLEGLGLSAEQIDSIMGMNGADIEKHKSTVADVQAQLDNATKQLTDANAAIEGFKKLNPEQLQAAADEWKTKFEQAQVEAQKNLEAVKFDHALDTALASAKAKNVKAVQALLSRDALKLKDDGSIEGLTDQLTKIRTENDYLFEDAKPAPKIVTGANNQPVINDPVIAAARKAANLKTE
jgi:predicted  nucleic acid-binding Zn-ribbon protein